MTDCVFCEDNWDKLDIVEKVRGSTTEREIIVFSPLNPVTPGHLLVVSAVHTPDAAANPTVAAELMEEAARRISNSGIQANIITSIGSAATQSVFHTHVHLVPRHENDGLSLPWTGQRKE